MNTTTTYGSTIDVIKGLPTRAQKTVVATLLGSMNMRIIYNALAAARQKAFEARNSSTNTKGYTKPEGSHIDMAGDLDTRGLEQTGEKDNGQERVDYIARLRTLAPLHEYFNAWNASLGNTQRTFKDSVQFVIDSPARIKSDEELKILADTMDVGLTAKDLKMVSKIQHNESLAQVLQYREDILQLVEDNINDADIDNDISASEHWNSLPEELRDALDGKAIAAMQKAMLQHVQGIMTARTGYELADLKLIKASLVDMEQF